MELIYHAEVSELPSIENMPELGEAILPLFKDGLSLHQTKTAMSSTSSRVVQPVYITPAGLCRFMFVFVLFAIDLPVDDG